MATAPTDADILLHTSAYHRALFSQHDLRHRLLPSLLRQPASPHPDQTTTKTILLAAQPIESSASSSAASSSSLRVTETTLLSLPRQTPQPPPSSYPSSTPPPTSRSMPPYASSTYSPSTPLPPGPRWPVVFEDLFVYHLYPALRWFKEQRSRILYKKAPDLRWSRSSVGMGLISTMSGDEAAELKELEAAYEEVVDENTRGFALFLKEVVQGRNGSDGVDQVWGVKMAQLLMIQDRSKDVIMCVPISHS